MSPFPLDFVVVEDSGDAGRTAQGRQAIRPRERLSFCSHAYPPRRLAGVHLLSLRGAKPRRPGNENFGLLGDWGEPRVRKLHLPSACHRKTDEHRRAKLPTMARMKKKGESGAAKNFVTRNQGKLPAQLETKRLPTASTHTQVPILLAALKKLQVSLSDFRRLCILKGIHPQQPRNSKRANKGSSAPASFYYAKDIAYLAHEPILRSLRDHKAFAKRLSRAIGRSEWAAAKNLEDAKPTYTLDHIIKQRYPTFDEALGDIDDALCMIALFANLPAKMYNLPEGVVDTCIRLKREWEEYVVRIKALRKTFLSIKGVYFQATIRGKDITWLVPYPFTQHVPHDVDFRIMSTFLELYTTLLSFVLFKLWCELGEAYPPTLDEAKPTANVSQTDSMAAAESKSLSKKAVRKAIRSIEQGIFEPSTTETELSAATEEASIAEQDDLAEFATQPLKPSVDTLTVASISAAGGSEATSLFRNCTVFLDRSTPLSLLSFLLRSYGSLHTRLGWDEVLAPHSPLKEDDSRITHVIIDRPDVAESSRRNGRKYVQPQWAVDCANRGSLLPEDKYEVGKVLPPHMSPFVEEEIVDEDIADGAEAGVSKESSGEGDEDVDKRDIGEDDEGDEVAANRPALEALLAASDSPDAAQDEGLVDAAELEAEATGGETEIERVRKLWFKATGGAVGAKSSRNTMLDIGAGAGKEMDDEARKMARGLLSNKQRKLYDKLTYTNNKKAEEKARLASRRKDIHKQNQKSKKADK